MEHNKQKKPRPVYLNLIKIRLPVGGVVSIIHRISGVALTLALIPMFYFLELSLRNEKTFNQVIGQLESPFIRLSLFGVFLLLIQHLFSGLRHLMLDMDLGVGRSVSRLSAWLTLVFTILVGAVVGVFWW